ncbi:MAG TPA: hypothetical protein PK331_07315 [Gordonia sp. (in: high G+C Gram-positive bacteria)]|uniref:hypothetical protein n=1 Tax=unclassified Gordonia (in: high G+C Gram-positive bacteria) TaxID=2657482 RepID=UPI000FA18A14|nr:MULTISPECIES: hypothetical protein [unclassified Gordonia (in: high G+C Gram-positive bacteria)]RUP38771.1 MAG: hypothetical protein EKK60_08780 [Gordonia sp. (in: high G+C Gram-positive bacteria)]HNP57370.1 hypothetical protein [Gordonia sp. (in: high G+C Gram-positive bacteria)]HRC50717.1 hypothetical protein [Gordonia sp. (in: high G+C Gram-positive bacteria)]
MISRITVAFLSAVLLGLGLAAPATADTTARQTNVGDLYVRAERPSGHQLESQYAAMWNPALPMDAKLANSYRGNTPQVRASSERMKDFSRMYDLMSVNMRSVAAPVINGNKASAKFVGVLAGFPAQNLSGYYVRDDGLWKLDWKATCASIGGCNGNPDWGY